MNRLAVTGLFVVCCALGVGVVAMAYASYRAAHSARDDILLSRASEIASTVAATARVTRSVWNNQQLAALCKETAVSGVAIEVVDLSGKRLASGGEERLLPDKATAPPSRVRRDLLLTGHARGAFSEGVEYWRILAGRRRHSMRRWMRRRFPPRHHRNDGLGREPGPGAHEGAPPEKMRRDSRRPGRRMGSRARRRLARLLRVRVHASLAEQTTSRAEVTLGLGAVAGATLLIVAIFFLRAARRAQRAEASLRKQAALAALGEMGAILAHEIRTPLGSIKGNAQLLAEGLEPDDRVTAIVSESERLEKLVNGMLQYARPADPQLAPCDPDAILERAAALVAPLALEANVRLLTETGDLGLCLLADEDQIGQVLVNLLRNAVEATSEARQRDVSQPQPVVVSVVRKGDRVVFWSRIGASGWAKKPQRSSFRRFLPARARAAAWG
jgi:hypothetical protein